MRARARPGPDMRLLFERAAGNGHYNEIIVDARYWDDHLPSAVEAVYYTRGSESSAIQAVRATHAGFLRRFGLDAAENPLLVLDRDEWNAPFSADA